MTYQLRTDDCFSSDIVDDCDVTIHDVKARERLETAPVFLLELGYYPDKTSIFIVMNKNNYIYILEACTYLIHTSLENCCHTNLLGGLERLRRIVIYLRTVSLCPEVHTLM
jgi:hypothetical protein